MTLKKYVCLMMLLTLLAAFGPVGAKASEAETKEYESTLFDSSYVHKIEILMDDWDTFIENCEDEKYRACTVVIDGIRYENIAIRAKGNTSLSSVRAMNSQRYSFKLEFDHYEDNVTCDGLDKLCLNNLIQDNTMMKDYLVYQLMDDFGVASPLCSYAYITVNGEDWGLYLAVEGVEDSFLSRNYGSDEGELYKPDSTGFGGGRGNGRDFNMEDFEGFEGFEGFERPEGINPQDGGMPWVPGGGEGQDGENSGMPGNFEMPEGFEWPEGFNPQAGGMPRMPGGTEGQDGNEGQDGTEGQESSGRQGGFGGFGGFGGGFGGGMGSDDVKLKYIDDDPESYPNIFDNAKTKISDEDRERLIASLKSLSEYSDLEEILDIDEVLRYFVAHVFVSNGDSYTGSMVHNYYLHEKDGKLSMIPWDYNLAFGSFQRSESSSTINASIDSPVSGGSTDDRPMVGWIFSDEGYTEMYHELFSEFLTKWFSDDEMVAMIKDTAEMLRPYVESDPTKFCTTDEFDKGVQALTGFVSLRSEAVSRQLDGNTEPVDTTGLNLSDMGSMNRGMGGGMAGMFGRGRDRASGQSAAGAEGNTGDTAENRDASGTDKTGDEAPPSAAAEDNDTTQTDNGKGSDTVRPEDTESSVDPEETEGSAEMNERTKWILVGVSALVLLGILLVVLKCRTGKRKTS